MKSKDNALYVKKPTLKKLNTLFILISILIVLIMERWASILICGSHPWKDQLEFLVDLFAPEEITKIRNNNIV